MYSYQEVYDATLTYFNGNELATSAWISKYALKNPDGAYLELTPDDMHRRLAKEFYKIEKAYGGYIPHPEMSAYGQRRKPLTEQRLYELFKDFTDIIPQGSVMAVAGDTNYIGSLSNCMVIETPHDSYGGIMYTDQQLAQLMKRRCGVGVDISTLRPENTPVKNVAKTSTGATSFMHRFSSTTEEVAQCLAGDTLVLTPNGLQEIKEVKKGCKIWTKKGYIPVNQVLSNQKSTVKLITRYGYEIEASSDHIVLTINKDGDISESKIGELSKDDKILLLLGDYLLENGASNNLKTFNYKTLGNPLPIGQPEMLNEQLAYLIGYAYGDGHIEKNKANEPVCMSLAVSTAWPKITDKLLRISETVLDRKLNLIETNGNWQKLNLSSKELLLQLELNGILKTTSNDMLFPDKILKGNRRIFFSFVAGYFDADGYCAGKKSGYVFNSTNLSFLKKLQVGLLAYGIMTKIHAEDRSKKGWQTLYSLVINGTLATERFLENMVGQSIKVSNKPFISKRDNYITPFSAKKLSLPHNKIDYINKDQSFSTKAFYKLKNDGYPIEDETPLVIDNVLEITKGLKQTTYDLVLTEEHLFWANGLYVHNSGRRGALMLTIDCRHPDILSFINIKQDLSKVNGANISIQWTNDFMDAVETDSEYVLRWPVEAPLEEAKVKKTVRAKEIWTAFVTAAHKTAEPGGAFKDRIRNYSVCNPYSEIVTSNPCVTGDTLVAVADGRTHVSIKELALSDSDVPVYTLNNRGKISVAWMRNPRKTGHKRVYEIEIENGHTIKVTDNHKFLLKNGTYVEAKDLRVGDSLFILSRVEKTIKEVFPKANSNSQKYVWFDYGRSQLKSEHRLIAEFNYNQKIPKGHVVHHRDFNSLNNTAINLQIMTREDHDRLHGDLMKGENNPMVRAKTEWSEEKWTDYRQKQSQQNSGKKNSNFSGYTNDDLKEHALELTRFLGRRFSTTEWVEYAKGKGLPMAFSKWRQTHLGSIQGFSKWAAVKLGLDDNLDVDFRVLSNFHDFLEQGYDCEIVEDRIMFNKVCEGCGVSFQTPDRENSICGVNCSSFDEIRTKNLTKFFATKQEETKRQQIGVYKMLAANLNREPKMKEWEEECKKQNVPFRVGKHKYAPFRTYADLKNTVGTYNHEVVSIRFIGEEDVYNGTVDDSHNFFVGGWEEDNRTVYLNNLQCGEIFMGKLDSCRLIATNMFGSVRNPYTKNAHFDHEHWYEMCYEATVISDDLVDLELEHVQQIIEKIENDPEPAHIKAVELKTWQEFYESGKKGRRIGGGYTALADTLAALGYKYDLADDITDAIAATKLRAEWDATTDLAIQRSAMPLWYEKGFLPTEFTDFLATAHPTAYERMLRYGRRNISVSTSAPTGTVSMLAKLVNRHGTTSGVEPLFALSYKRRKRINNNDENAHLATYTDDNGEKWLEFDVFHNGLLEWAEINNTNPHDTNSPYHNACAPDIDWTARVRIQAILQKYITHSISSTVNLPKTATVKDVDTIYREAHKQGLKGITIYVDGSRSGILVTEDQQPKLSKNNAPKRPKALPCTIKHVKWYGDWLVTVGYLDDEPFEVFAFKHEPIAFEKGTLIKEGNGSYTLETPDGLMIYDITKDYDGQNEEALTRLISGALRHGMDIKFIVEQLGKSRGVITSFAKVIYRTLKDLLPEGTELKGTKCPECGGQLMYIEGCKMCSCGYSACS